MRGWGGAKIREFTERARLAQTPRKTNEASAVLKERRGENETEKSKKNPREAKDSEEDNSKDKDMLIA